MKILNQILKTIQQQTIEKKETVYVQLLPTLTFSLLINVLFYIMAIEIATAIDGQISEDDKESWLSVEEFRNRHEDILSMSYEQANEMSLEEIPFMDDVRDPIWEEDDRRNEEYIKTHGEVELDDEEE